MALAMFNLYSLPCKQTIFIHQTNLPSTELKSVCKTKLCFSSNLKCLIHCKCLTPFLTAKVCTFILAGEYNEEEKKAMVIVLQ